MDFCQLPVHITVVAAFGQCLSKLWIDFKTLQCTPSWFYPLHTLCSLFWWKTFNKAESGYTVGSGRTDRYYSTLSSRSLVHKTHFQVFICADGQFALKTTSAAASALSSWENVENCFSHVCIIKHAHPLLPPQHTDSHKSDKKFIQFL